MLNTLVPSYNPLKKKKKSRGRELREMGWLSPFYTLIGKIINEG